jgi:hypothetical protein
MKQVAALVFVFLNLAACTTTSTTSSQSTGIPDGQSQRDVALLGVSLPVYTYRPAQCQPRLLLLSFHGSHRTVHGEVLAAKPLADRVCAIVVAPHFTAAAFSFEQYQMGGVPYQGRGSRSIDMVPPLIAWARAAAGNPELPVVMEGHSAGGQFLGRVAAFVPTGAVGIIIANPSTWVLPSATTAAPYGFGGTDSANDDAVRAYLALPITVLLGTADLGTAQLVNTPEARAQGERRYSRGLNTFRMAREVAQSHGWKFGWSLAEVPGVGHDSAAMYGSPQAFDAVQRALAFSDRLSRSMSLK